MVHDAQDRVLMQLALEEAEQGGSEGEVPVGAVITLEGTVLARAHNRPIALRDPTAHAEILAIRAAAAAIGAYRLGGASLYVTLEPCAMCMGAVVQARIARLKYGARDPKAGAAGSLYDIGRDGRLNHWIEIYPELMAAESTRLLEGFFVQRRRAHL